MIDITDPKDCCGCTACEAICPKDAITMKPDALGFQYPVVDLERCIDCDACVRVCAFNDRYDKSANLPEPEAFAIRHKNPAHLDSSRSGGTFVAISDRILQMGGAVYGAGYTDHFRVAHKRAVTPEERDEFKGSKYVQSDLTGIFRMVKADLRAGMPVMFSGTPCQTAGLISFIGPRLRENLYVVDILCHGTPGPYIWRDYIAYIEKKMGEPLVKVDFRDKKHFGWRAHRESYATAHKFRPADTYTYLFYEHVMFRHSCGVCPFTNLTRPSDITLADFWGWEKAVPGFNADDRGVSLVLCNTVKGRELLESVKDSLDMLPTRPDVDLNPNLRRPSIISPARDSFERDYAARGLGYVMRRYGNIGLRYKLKVGRRKFRTLLRKTHNLLAKHG